MSAPGICADCGNDAYIYLAKDGDEMLCAHCFSARREERRADEAPVTSPEQASRAH